MVRIVKKGFLGQLIGVGIIILVVYISSEFNVDTGILYKVIFISIGVISIIFSLFWDQIFDGLSNMTDVLFDSYDYNDRISKLYSKIRKTQDQNEIKKLIISFTKKEKLKVIDLKCLIQERKIIDDEFWIKLFVDNVEKISVRTGVGMDLVDFESFLRVLKNDESRIRLRRILTSKGVLIEEKYNWK